MGRRLSAAGPYPEGRAPLALANALLARPKLEFKLGFADETLPWLTEENLLPRRTGRRVLFHLDLTGIAKNQDHGFDYHLSAWVTGPPFSETCL